MVGRVDIGAYGDGAPHGTGAVAKTDRDYTKTDSFQTVEEHYQLIVKGMLNCVPGTYPCVGVCCGGAGGDRDCAGDSELSGGEGSGRESDKEYKGGIKKIPC